MRPLRRPFVLLGLLGLLGTGVAMATAAPVQVTDDRGHTLTLAAPPQRIVSLLPSLTACENVPLAVEKGFGGSESKAQLKKRTSAGCSIAQRDRLPRPGLNGGGEFGLQGWLMAA